MGIQQKIEPQEFQFTRFVRTAYSEGYYIFHKNTDGDGKIRVGSFDLHISGKVFFGTLVLEIKLKNKELENLIAQIDNQLIETAGIREDFILSVYKGKQIGSYSDIIDEQQRRYEPSTRGDLENISANLAKVLGRHQDTRGKLNEHALCSYFQSLGYTAELAGSELDQKKIDVIARGRSEIIFAQAKLGAISSFEMRAVVKSVASLSIEGNEQKVAAIAASFFPKDCEILRRNLEKEFNTPLLCIQKYQVIQSAPEYRRMLE